MQVSEKALKEFEVLWREDHPNQEITHEELLVLATRVLRAVELLYKEVV